MDYRTAQYTDGWGCPAVPTSSQTPRLDGLPTSSEALVSTRCQDHDKTSTSLSQLKGKNTINSLLSNNSQAKTFEPKEAEYTDQSGDTVLNTECKFYSYINILITDTLLVESSCSTPDPEHLDYTTSRTLSAYSPRFAGGTGGAESDETKPRVPPSLIRDKKYRGMFYCCINILLLIYY